jgi:hypothetical protein
LPEHPFDVRQAATGLHCSVLSCQIPHWDDSLTPWTAPGLYREDPSSNSFLYSSIVLCNCWLFIGRSVLTVCVYAVQPLCGGGKYVGIGVV